MVYGNRVQTWSGGNVTEAEVSALTGRKESFTLYTLLASTKVSRA